MQSIRSDSLFARNRRTKEPKNIFSLLSNPNYVLFFWGIGCCFFLTILFPGDIPFINDEAKLIANAWKANKEHRLVLLGLEGTVGIAYGPLPTWFYQVCLLVTKNLIWISLGKNILSFFLLFGILVIFSQKISYSPYPILFVFLSPYIYFIHRSLWDDCFVIPLSAALYLLYGFFSLQPRLRFFYATIGLSVILLHIQAKSVFSILAVAITYLLFEYHWLKKHRWQATFGVVTGVLICSPYFLYLFQHLTFQGGREDKQALGEAIQSGIGGIQFISFFGWSKYYFPEMVINGFSFLPPSLCYLLIFLSSFCIVSLFALGFVDSVKQFIKHLRSKYTVHSKDKSIRFLLQYWKTEPTGGIKNRWTESMDIEGKLSFLCGITIIIYTLFFCFTRHHYQPHYLVGVWFAYYYFFWKKFNFLLQKSAKFTWLMGGCSILIILLFVNIILGIHRHGGNRGVYYGATLKNQIAVVEKLATYSPKSNLLITVQNYKYFPHALQTLLTLHPSKNPAVHHKVNKKNAYLLIDYRDRDNLLSGKIALYIRENTSQETYQPSSFRWHY